MTATPLTGPPAGVGRRFAAYLVDQLPASLLGGLAAAAVLLAADDGATGPALALLVAVPALGLAYGIVLWWWLATRGLSPGKKALGLRVVSASDGLPIGWGRAFVRQLVLGVVLGFTAGIGAIVLAVATAREPRRRGWHDRAAGSVVIGPGVGPVPPPAAPPARPVPGVVPVALPGARPAGRPGADLSPDGHGITDPLVPTRPLPGETDGAPVVTGGPPPAPVASAPVASGPISWVPGMGSAGAGSAPAPAAPGLSWTPSIEVEQTRQAAPQPEGDRWVLSVGGRDLPVEGPGLIGRDPQPRGGESVVHLVPVDDPHRSVSKTHLAFGVDADGLWVRDRGSTNGSAVVGPDGVRRPCPPEEPVPVAPGSTVLVGDLPVRVGRD